MTTPSDRQCDWLAWFATAPDWNDGAVRAADEFRHIHGVSTNEHDLEVFLLSEGAADRGERALRLANAVRETNCPLAMAFELLALRVADLSSDIRDNVNRALGLVASL